MKPVFVKLVFILTICLMLVSCAPSESGSQNGAGHTHNSPLPAKPEPTVTDAPPHEPDVSHTVNSAVGFELDAELENEYEYEYFEFNLGRESYTAQSGKTMPFQLRGIMAVPIGTGPFPVVLITHGSHENVDETKRFDTGFDYLVSALAQNGYIAISMDMSMPYIWQYGDVDDAEKSVYIAGRHIETLLAANRGESLFPSDITGKLDTDKIALLGHSRGGETIYYIAEQQQALGVNIQTLLSLAPAWSTLRYAPDVNSAIIVPQYDGDVARLDGIALYDFLVNNTTGDRSVTFLLGANHNFFNRNIQRDDTSFGKLENGYPPLKREQQEDFLKKFSVGFFNASFGIEDKFYMSENLQPNKMYGYSVTRRVRMKDAVSLADVSVDNDFSSKTATVKYVVDSFFFREDGVDVDTVTVGMLDDNFNPTNLNRSLISIEWRERGSKVEIIPQIKDLSEMTSLTIGLVPDSSSLLNTLNNPLRFTVTLADGAGNKASVPLPAYQRALTCYPGEPEITELADMVVRYWSPPTPPGSVNLPLSLFEGVDLKNIKLIELTFDENETGSLLIESVVVQ